MILHATEDDPGSDAPRSDTGRGRLLILTLLLGMALLGACSNGQLYSAIQENRLQACETYPLPQQAECRARYDMEFKEYQRLRRETAEPDQEGRTEKR